MVRGVSKQVAAGWKDSWRPTGASLTVFSIALVCFGFYANAMYKKTQTCRELRDKIQKVETLRALLLSEREDLRLELSSYDDDAWKEMVLKKRLGVVPEGQMKVYFKKEQQ